MEGKTKKPMHRGHNEGNIRQRTDGRWEVRLSAGIDYKTGKPKRTSTCCNTKQEAIAILQEQAHDIRVNGWRDPMSVTLGEWYEYWLVTYMKDKVKQSTYMSYRGYGNKHFCVLYKIRLKKLEGRILQEFYNYKYREEGLSAKTLRNYHMALHKCLQQAVKERLIVTNPCDAVTLPSGEKPEIAALTNEQQRALVQISYRHRYGVFVRLDLSTGLRMGELLALRWEDIDLVGAQLTVKRTINRLARYEQDEGKHSTEIVFDTPKTQNARRTIPLTRSVIEDLKRWRSIQLADQNAAGAAYQDTGFVVTAASKSWRIPQGSPSSLWEGVSKFHYPPRCHRARFAESGLRLRRSLGWLFRNHLLEAIVVAAHLMPLSRGFCACIMVYSVFNVQRKASWRMSLHLSPILGHFCKVFLKNLRNIF